MKAKVSPLMRQMLEHSKTDSSFRDDLFKALLGRTKEVRFNGKEYRVESLKLYEKEKQNDN